jgi:flagellar biosynthesis GTPase FlhF
MHMKSYTATDMKEAMRMARVEMGDNAVMLSTDTIPDGRVVVTFALEHVDDYELFEDEEMPRPSADFFRQSAPASPAPAAKPSPEPIKTDTQKTHASYSPSTNGASTDTHSHPEPRSERCIEAVCLERWQLFGFLCGRLFCPRNSSWGQVRQGFRNLPR